jgi:hypothetical protein
MAMAFTMQAGLLPEPVAKPNYANSLAAGELVAWGRRMTGLGNAPDETGQECAAQGDFTATLDFCRTGGSEDRS